VVLLEPRLKGAGIGERELHARDATSCARAVVLHKAERAAEALE
jgi:hypothetical protein